MAVSATVTLQGHLFDSLTLNKVLDYILGQGGEYLLNTVQVGQRKEDLSFVNMTVYAPGREELDRILEELKAHGGRRAEPQNAELKPVVSDGTIPEGAYVVSHLPAGALVDGQWYPLASNQPSEALVLVADRAEGQLHVRRRSELEVGDQVLVGSRSLQWRAPRRG